MKRIRRGVLGATLLVLLVSPSVSAAESLDDTRLTLVRQHCVAAQATMQQVLRSDTAVRINRGRSYEELIKLLAAFNSRAALNTYDVSALVQTTSQIETEFDAFKSTWIGYETSLKEGLRIRCQEQPQQFYDSLAKTRGLRASLTGHIDNLGRQLDAYRQGFEDVRTRVADREAAS